MTAHAITDFDFDRLRIALAFEAYEMDTVRLEKRDLAGFTHIVASRKGLYVVNPTTCCLLAHGFFFGITLREGDIYLFESCDMPSSTLRRGRIVKLVRRGRSIVAAQVLAKGLDNGCHQIDFFAGRLHIVDTYNQQVVGLSSNSPDRETLSPLPTSPSGRWSSKDLAYVHVNSVLSVADRILLLLHNGSEHTGRTSEVAVYDRDWRPLGRWALDGRSCHGLATLEDGELLTCDSMGGALISAQGLRVPVSPHMTRGLSVGADQIVVGASLLVERGERMRSAGTVTFMDRDYKISSVIDVPGAPTEIRRLDGLDSSLSGYLQTVSWGRNLKAGTAS